MLKAVPAAAVASIAVGQEVVGRLIGSARPGGNGAGDVRCPGSQACGESPLLERRTLTHPRAAFRDAMAVTGLEIRSGLHTGEIEVSGQDVTGIAVHIAARVCALAGAGQILVSSTVRDLVGTPFRPCVPSDANEIPNPPEPWRLYAASA